MSKPDVVDARAIFDAGFREGWFAKQAGARDLESAVSLHLAAWEIGCGLPESGGPPEEEAKEEEIERLNAILRIAHDSVGLATDDQLRAFLSQSESAQ